MVSLCDSWTTSPKFSFNTFPSPRGLFRRTERRMQSATPVSKTPAARMSNSPYRAAVSPLQQCMDLMMFAFSKIQRRESSPRRCRTPGACTMSRT